MQRFELVPSGCPHRPIDESPYSAVTASHAAPYINPNIIPMTTHMYHILFLTFFESVRLEAWLNYFRPCNVRCSLSHTPSLLSARVQYRSPAYWLTYTLKHILQLYPRITINQCYSTKGQKKLSSSHIFTIQFNSNQFYFFTLLSCFLLPFYVPGVDHRRAAPLNVHETVRIFVHTVLVMLFFATGRHQIPHQ